VANPRPSDVLGAAKQQARMSFDDLWIAYFGLGGMSAPQVVHAVLDGSIVPSNSDYTLLAQALDERFSDLGMRRPLPDARDVGL
jgi:hypothetical protein